MPESILDVHRVERPGFSVDHGVGDDTTPFHSSMGGWRNLDLLQSPEYVPLDLAQNGLRGLDNPNSPIPLRSRAFRVQVLRASHKDTAQPVGRDSQHPPKPHRTEVLPCGQLVVGQGTHPSR